MSGRMDAAFRYAMAPQPILDCLVRTLFPISFPLGVDIRCPFQALGTIKVKSVQRAEKQCGFVGSLLQVFKVNTVRSMTLEQVEPRVFLNLDALGLRDKQRDVSPVGLRNILVAGCFQDGGGVEVDNQSSARSFRGSENGHNAVNILR